MSPLEFVGRLFFITVGALLFSVGLEMILLPNSMLDGGLVGISILISSLLGTKFGYVLFIIHLPFIYFGFKQMGKWFAIFVAYGVLVVSVTSSLMHHSPAITDEPFLAVIFGGIFVGAGVGIAIKAGGCLDGMEIIAIYLSRKTPFSVGQLLMLINIVIFACAALMFGWESAMYSIVSFFIASKAIHVVEEGFDEMKEVVIIADNYAPIGEAIKTELSRNYTLVKARGGISGEPRDMIMVFVSRLEETKLKSIVLDVDPHAVISVSSISEVRGSMFKSKGH